MSSIVPKPPQTPPPRNARLQGSVSETPAKMYPSAALELLTLPASDRAAVHLHELGADAPEKTFEYWLSDVLPTWRWPITLWALVLAELVKSGDYNDQEQRWTDLPLDPAREKRHETIVFAGLKKIAVAIFSAMEHLEPTLAGQATAEYHHQSHKSPRTNPAVPISIRPDAYSLAQRRTPQPASHHPTANLPATPPSPVSELLTELDDPDHAWFDLSSVEEFKKQSGDRHTARMQVVLGMYHVVDAYPQRSHVYGTTYRGVRLRGWQLSREGLLLSQEIDVHKEPLQYIEYLARLRYGSRAQLGFDDTYEVDNTGRLAIQMQVNGELRPLKVLRVLFTHPAHNIRSRGTRVYEVEDPTSKRVYALKDCWLEPDCPSEKTVLNDILTAHEAAERDNPDAVQTAQARFMPIESEWVVQLAGTLHRTPGHVDEARGTMGHLELPLTGLTPAPLQTPTEESSVSPSLSGELRREMPLPMRDFIPPGHRFQREHRRVLYGEVGIPLHKVRNALTRLTVLRDCAWALRAMCKARCTHRDFKPHNAYARRSSTGAETAFGLVADCELAAPFGGVTNAHAARTGTRFFCAVEQWMLAWQWAVARRAPQPPSGGSASTPPETSDDTTRSRPVTTNTIHDFEAFLWTLIYLILFYVPTSNPVQAPMQARARHTLFNFTDACPTSRLSFLKTACVYIDGREILPEEFVPPEMLVLWDIVLYLRHTIVDDGHQVFQRCWSEDVFITVADTVISALDSWIRYDPQAKPGKQLASLDLIFYEDATDPSA